VEAGFPFARGLVIVHATRGHKAGGPSSSETRYYLSSQQTQERGPAAWLGLVRGHWAGVENRNHWRRDACMGEDRTRSKNPNLVANLALIRSALLALINEHHPDANLPGLIESFALRPSKTLALLRAK
jgi:hypothetical protein